jgi:CHAT domain-containing protein
MANCYSQLGNNLKSIAFYEKAAAHFQANSMGLSPETGLCYSNLAIVYKTLGNLQKQEEYLQKALMVWDTLRLNPLPGPVSDIRFGASAMKSLGEAKMLQGRLEEAKKYTIEALNWAQKFSSRELVHDIHLQLANIYVRSGQADSASLHFEYAMGGTGWQAAREYWSVKSAPGELALFRFDQARKSGDTDAMEQAWREWQKFEQFLLENRGKLTGNDTRTSFLTRIRPLVQAALFSARYLSELTGNKSYLNDAFLLTEKTRALTLFEGVQESKALHYGDVPDSLIALERNLRLDIALLDKEIFYRDIVQDSSTLSIASKLFLLKNQAEILQKTFETDYPDYYRLKYDLRVEDVAAVQRDLLYPDVALVEYFVGDSAVYIFTVGKKDYSVLEVKKDFPLEKWVAQLRRGMTAFHTDPNMAAQYDSLSTLYAEAAANIYQKLVAPIAAKLPAKVIFIPDGVLGYVPFEALLVEKPENPTRWSQHHYLLNDHSISYCYSATMLREMLYRKHKKQPALDFLGFAPHYNGDTAMLARKFPHSFDMRKDLKLLPHSGEEVYRIANIMKGQAFVGDAASATAFADQAGQARILHLATHGQANDRTGDYCFLVFADQKDSAENEILYARDIYNLQLNADLVTLSACETGIGELQGGEGIISLARAFAYAGAKSIVTSLWSVSDAKTKDLMIDFYKNLRKGMLKDEALRQAKLDFLKRNRGQVAHPFYWAGFVGIGNMGRIK